MEKESIKKLQTVILAGGFGTRLAPLTDNKPKPLVRVLDKMVLETVIDKAVGNITVSVYYQPQMIEKVCEKYKKDIKCVCEKRPLGTAGAVKYCHDGQSENILVLSGDAVSDIDVGKAVEYHIENNNDVTVVTTHKEDPTELGNVVCDETGRITDFCEKPCWECVKSGRVNTGIYVIKRQVLELIPDNTKYDFAKDLFPKMLKAGCRIYSFYTESFWCDIGTLDQYYYCNKAALTGKTSCVQNTTRNLRLLSDMGVTVGERVYVSKGAEIGTNVKIANDSVVCDGCVVAENCDISKSLVGQGTVIGKGSTVSGAIVGEKVQIGENCIIPEGCVIGDGTVICEGTVLKENTRLEYAGKTDKKNGGNSVFSHNRELFCEEAKAMFEMQNVYEYTGKFVFSVVSVMTKRMDRPVKLGVMGHISAVALKEIVKCAAVSSKAYVFDMGEGDGDMLEYCSDIAKCDINLLCKTQQDKAMFLVLDKNGNKISSDTERKIQKLFTMLCTNEKSALVLDGIESFKNSIVKMPCAELYENMLCCALESFLQGTDLEGVSFAFSKSHETKANRMVKLFGYFGARLVPSDNDKLKLGFDEEGKAFAKIRGLYVDSNHLKAVALNNLDALGVDSICLDETALEAYKVICRRKNIRTDMTFGKRSIYDRILTDESVCLCAFAAITALTAKTLEELTGELVSFEVYSDELIGDMDRSRGMEELSKLYGTCGRKDTRGIKMQLAKGTVTVIPGRIRGFKIFAESTSAETAKEVCVQIERALAENSKQKYEK